MISVKKSTEAKIFLAFILLTSSSISFKSFGASDGLVRPIKVSVNQRDLRPGLEVYTNIDLARETEVNIEHVKLIQLPSSKKEFVPVAGKPLFKPPFTSKVLPKGRTRLAFKMAKPVAKRLPFDYYAAITFSRPSKKVESKGGVDLVAKIRMLFVFRVSYRPQSRGSSRFKVKIIESPELKGGKLKLKLKNSGVYPYYVSGNARIGLRGAKAKARSRSILVETDEDKFTSSKNRPVLYPGFPVNFFVDVRDFPQGEYSSRLSMELSADSVTKKFSNVFDFEKTSAAQEVVIYKPVLRAVSASVESSRGRDKIIIKSKYVTGALSVSSIGKNSQCAPKSKRVFLRKKTGGNILLKKKLPPSCAFLLEHKLGEAVILAEAGQARVLPKSVYEKLEKDKLEKDKLEKGAKANEE